jgi:YegS/Rv2252/BmrU family lipid kinase
VRLAAEAADAGFSTVVAAGGDGTVNEVLHGIDRANAFGEVDFGILPLGTGNNFAEQIGIPDLDTAFAVLADGDRRRIDLGYANDRLFVNSCVAGLTAESSSETPSDMKRRFGVLAYVLTTLRTVSDFEALRLTVDIEIVGQDTQAWAGDTLCLMVGSGRRFPTSGTSQAHMEDGLFDFVVIEDVSPLDLMSDTVVERLLGRDSASIQRFKSASLGITIDNPAATRFSLDGEIIRERELSLTVRPQTLTVAVGETYDPTPD